VRKQMRYICLRKFRSPIPGEHQVSITEQAVPTGTWTLDPVHSRAAFGVRHSGIATFRGHFTELRATLADGVLEGAVDVASVEVPVAQLKGHLQSPDFFDAEQHPQITFRAEELQIDGERLAVRGELTMRGVTRALEATGTFAGPATYLDGSERVAISLETVVNRHDFGVSWNAPLPGGGNAVGDDVTLTVDLQLIRA
jgi:polyisoprenoid-binding protein YceI